jgi:hypothetical protein
LGRTPKCQGELQPAMVKYDSFIGKILRKKPKKFEVKQKCGTLKHA